MPRLSGFDLGIIRSPGPGLGNLLFPIARALIGRERYGGELVYPTMRQVKFGTILRRERDLRTYGRVLRPRTARDWRLWVQWRTMTAVHEAAYMDGCENVAVIYEGLGRQFHDLAGHSQYVGQWLRATRWSDSPLAQAYDIGLHIRLGDFTPGKSNAPTHNVRQEIEWYRSALDLAKSLMSTTRPRVRLFTDGDAAELARQIGIGDLDIDTSVNALTAMLNLSQAATIITSRSSFSMWGVYLGNARAIWDRRFDIERTFPWRQGIDMRH
ncbi:MAG: hypothetical protein AB7U75_10135 [Hyphomicrobiaceae bacterium]